MSDGLDWDDDDFEESFVPLGQKDKELEKKFEDEDEDEDEPKHVVEASKPKKERKAYEDKGRVIDDVPLDDPELEKQRKARLQEEADFQSTLDTFGDDVGRKLDKFIPKTDKDFEEFSKLLLQRHITPHKKSKHYKALMKHILRGATESMKLQEVRDLESCLAGIRQVKIKEEKTEKENAAKKGKKASLNVGKSKEAAGLDDEFLYDDPNEDDFDFM